MDRMMFHALVLSFCIIFLSFSVRAENPDISKMSDKELSDYQNSIMRSPEKLRPLAEKGIPWAMGLLGRYYYDGIDGSLYIDGEETPADKCIGLHLLDMAARHGDARAQLRISTAYYWGEGVSENCQKSYYWAKTYIQNGGNPSYVEYELQHCAAELSGKEKEDFKDFDPEKEPPLEILDIPKIFPLNGLIKEFTGGESCR
jgi:hypothetical protein